MAAITGTYDGTVTLTDQLPPTSYRLMAEGQGGPGFLKGSRSSRCAPTATTTMVDVAGTVQTGGADRAPRPAADRRRLEDDAGPLLRLPAGQAGDTRLTSARASGWRAGAAPREHRNHRAAVVRAGVDVGVHVAQVLARLPAPRARSSLAVGGWPASACSTPAAARRASRRRSGRRARTDRPAVPRRAPPRRRRSRSATRAGTAWRTPPPAPARTATLDDESRRRRCPP